MDGLKMLVLQINKVNDTYRSGLLERISYIKLALVQLLTKG